MSFRECVMACAANSEFVAGFDKLTHSNLSFRGSGLDLAIDKATGRLDIEAQRFIEFVYECVWTRCPRSSTGRASSF